MDEGNAFSRGLNLNVHDLYWYNFTFLNELDEFIITLFGVNPCRLNVWL